MSKLIPFWLGVSLFIVEARASDDCLKMYLQMKRDTERVEELNRLKAELGQKFTDHVKQDFDAQAEGLIDEVHRSQALKVAFAQKRLIRTIEAKTRSIAAVNSEYCAKCVDKVKNGDAAGEICSYCPDAPACAKPKSGKK